MGLFFIFGIPNTKQMEWKTKMMWLVFVQRLIQRIPRPGMGNSRYDDATLFEFLILETFQAGLSWITILNKGRISGKRSTISTIKK
jgi:3-methyladenine DNA glycosylase Tag